MGKHLKVNENGNYGDFKINLDGFTETIIIDKTEYKVLIKQICDEYFTPDNFQNNLLLKLSIKMLFKGVGFTS